MAVPKKVATSCEMVLLAVQELDRIVMLRRRVVFDVDRHLGNIERSTDIDVEAPQPLGVNATSLSSFVLSCVRISSTPGTAKAVLRINRSMRPRAIVLVTRYA
jgi:hypothetical protein